jgi:uncharacterized protein YacL
MVILHGSVMNTTINTVTAIGQTTKGLENIPIILQATQGNETIFCTLVTTTKDGNYFWYFYPPNDGTVFIAARLVSLIPIDGNSTSTGIRGQLEEIISIAVIKPLLPSIGIVVSVVLAFMVLVLFPRWIPRFSQYSIIIAVFFVIIGYIILYRWLH